MGEWTPTSWWNGRVSNGYTSCGTCVGKTDYSFDENNPEICYCAQQAKNNDGEVTTTSKVDPIGGIWTTGPMGEEVTTCTEKLEEVTRGQIAARSSTTSPKVGRDATRLDKPELSTRTSTVMGGDVTTNRVTSNFMKMKRRLQWEKDLDWGEEDIDRKIESTEALEVDLQDLYLLSRPTFQFTPF